jgi:hypothetical protein
VRTFNPQLLSDDVQENEKSYEFKAARYDIEGHGF